MRNPFKKKRTPTEERLIAERKLRFAMINFLQKWDGDYEFALDVCSEAHWGWTVVLRQEETSGT